MFGLEKWTKVRCVWTIRKWKTRRRYDVRRLAIDSWALVRIRGRVESNGDM